MRGATLLLSLGEFPAFRVDRKTCAKPLDLRAHAGFRRAGIARLRRERVQRLDDASPNDLKLSLSEAARRCRRRAKRTPEVTAGFSGSNGMPFLLQVMPARSRLFSASRPVILMDRRSTNIRCESVPPETISSPACSRVAASALAFATTALAYCLNAGCKASCNATAFAAITCISGPPCRPGKTAALILLPISSSLARIRPPLGPRRGLVCGRRDDYVRAAGGSGRRRRLPARRNAPCRPSDRRRHDRQLRETGRNR